MFVEDCGGTMKNNREIVVSEMYTKEAKRTAGLSSRFCTHQGRKDIRVKRTRALDDS